MVQQLKLCAFNIGGVGSIPGWGTKILHAMCAAKKKRKERKLIGAKD